MILDQLRNGRQGEQRHQQRQGEHHQNAEHGREGDGGGDILAVRADDRGDADEKTGAGRPQGREAERGAEENDGEFEHGLGAEGDAGSKALRRGPGGAGCSCRSAAAVRQRTYLIAS